MSTVLYDEPGPRAKRTTLYASVVAAAVVAVLLFVVYRRLDQNGQFSSARWSPVINPSDTDFPAVWRLLGKGIRNTLTAAALSIVLSLVVGTILASLRLLAGRVSRLPLIGLIELLRGVPVVIMIFLVSRVLPSYGLDFENQLWYLVIGLTLYNSVVIAEIIRAGVASLPRGQGEAALAIGMTKSQSLRLVQLPQAFRVMLPSLISQLVVVLKDTSLGFIILYSEVLRTANLIIQETRNPIQMYLVIGALFVLTNYTLGRFAQYTERRLSRSSSTVGIDEPLPAIAGA